MQENSKLTKFDVGISPGLDFTTSEVAAASLLVCELCLLDCILNWLHALVDSFSLPYTSRLNAGVY